MRDYQNMKALIFDINLLALLIMSNQICRKGNNSYIVSINILYGRMQSVKVVSDCSFGIFKLFFCRALTPPHVSTVQGSR
jgi:hypothetical protein